MINQELLKSLSVAEKDALKNTLESIINQTYIVENEYKELNKSYKNLRTIIEQIIEALPNAIWVLNSDGNIFLNNSEAKELDKLFEQIDLSDISQIRDEIEVEGRFYSIKINENSVNGKTIITATDITEEKRRDRLASMGQMAAHLAHEIRNPIGSVALLASTLLKRVDIKHKPIIFEIKKSIWRVERIVKATLLFSKGLNLNKEKFFISNIVDELETAINHYTYSKEIEFKYNVPSSKKIYADLDLLSIVFQNFIFNAIDAIEADDKETGLVELCYEDDKEYHIFKIYDDGEPFENKNILFEPFKTTKTKGNGLGLALSLQIINKHHGKIELINDRKGFKISIKKREG